MTENTYSTICTECGYLLLSWPRHQTWARLAVEAMALGEGFYSFTCQRCGAAALLSYEAGSLNHYQSVAHPREGVPQGVLDRALAEAEQLSATPDQSLERLRRVRERLTQAHRRRTEREREQGPS